MKITKINNFNNTSFNSRKRIITQGVKILVPAGAMVIAGDSFQKSKKDESVEMPELIDEFIPEDIGNSTENEEYDQSFDSYYHIDLNFANSKVFRDSELFNPLLDNEHDSGYLEYDKYDLETSNNFPISIINITRLNENFGGYRTSDTDFGKTEMPDSVTKPYDKKYDVTATIIKFFKQQQIQKDLLEITRKENIRKNLERTIPSDVLKELRKSAIIKQHGQHIKVLDKNLEKTAIYLYNNKIYKNTNYIDPIVFKIMKIVNRCDRELTCTLDTKVKEMLFDGYKNIEIFRYVNEYLKNYRNNTIHNMDCYDCKTGIYNLK